ncbi:MAG: galactose-1-epimerase [Caldithrix sp.]|nr:galactose-1-epimerase [Caldithrix sp.]
MKNKVSVLGVLMSMLLLACAGQQQPQLSVTSEPFGPDVDGQPIHLYTLSNVEGMMVTITNYGAIVQSIKVPDRDGNIEDVVLGFDSLQSYIEDDSYFGGLVGRYGNRIAKGKFTLDGNTYTLATNNGPNHLHGGDQGFNKVVWKGQQLQSEKEVGVKLTYVSPDGEEGYPGTLTTTVIYSLNNDNAFKIEYRAKTDQPTVVNLTHHGYFNLSGNNRHNILDHKLMINADRFTPVDETLIPTGERRSVEGTPMDFRQPTAIGSRIDTDYEQLEYGKGYDHNWVLNDVDGTLKLQTTLYDPQSGRFMEISTVEPGMQFYSGNFLDGSIIGKNGQAYELHDGLCLEPQHFPDAPNQPDFPSTELRPGETYQSTSVYRFSVK